MTTSSVQPSRPNPHFMDPGEPTISQGCECYEHDLNCSCPNANSRNSRPPQEEDVETRYRLVGLFITLTLAAFGGIVYLLDRFLGGSGRGPRGGGTAGGEDPRNPPVQTRDSSASSQSEMRSVSEMGCLDAATESSPPYTYGMGFIAPSAVMAGTERFLDRAVYKVRAVR